MRRNFPDKIKIAAFERANGHCEQCLSKIISGPQYDHIIPDGLGGDPILDNCQVLCSKCHRLKTAKADVPRIAKAKRTERKRLNAWPKRPLRGRGFEKRRELDPDT